MEHLWFVLQRRMSQELAAFNSENLRLTMKHDKNMIGLREEGNLEVFVKVHRNKGFWVGASLCFGALLTLFLVAQTTGEAYGKKVIRLGADPDVASVGDTITLIAGVSDKAQGKTVLFVVESGSATLSATSAQTDAEGWATITATITGAGSITFKASSTG
jgi:hypothetical protein